MSDSKSPSRKPATVAEVMLGKAGALKPDDSVQAAGDKMRAARQSNAPVAENRKLVGMVDTPHPDQQATRYGHDPETTTVGESMNRQAVFCFEEDDRAHALELLVKNDLTTLPVVDREMRIVGMVTREDLDEKES